MRLFNAVLLPDVDYRDRLVNYAQNNYDKFSNGYCLSNKAYPHITLCQFKTDDQPMIFIDDLFTPIFTEPNIRPGDGIHKGYNWIEWLVKKDDWLVELQENVRDVLASEGAQVLTDSGPNYYPHMAFCRTSEKSLSNIPLAAVEQSEKPWIFTIGELDPNGQFLG
ncbi:MAG: hypothetical protein NZ828_10245 [Alphaproteobacteria bacterium]|jgi:hypothetical protein|nr:hypothetical protein [Alphaproteobacteria bacterium]